MHSHLSRAEVVWEGRVDTAFIGAAAEDWDKWLVHMKPLLHSTTY